MDATAAAVRWTTMPAATATTRSSWRGLDVRPAYAPEENPFASPSWRREPSRARTLGMPGWLFTMLASGAAALALGQIYEAFVGSAMGGQPSLLLPLAALVCCGLTIVAPSLSIAREMERLKRATLFSQVYLTPATHLDFLRPAMRAGAMEIGRIIAAVLAASILYPPYWDDIVYWWGRRMGIGAPMLYIAALFPIVLWFNAAVTGWVACQSSSKVSRMFFSMIVAILPFLFFSVHVKHLPLEWIIPLHGAGLALLAWAFGRLIHGRDCAARFWGDNLLDEESQSAAP